LAQRKWHSPLVSKPLVSKLLNFLDTNILLYAIDDADMRKQRIARELIETCSQQQSGVLSTQVLLEYVANLTRKYKVSRKTAALMAAAFAEWPVIDGDMSLVMLAMARSAESNLSIWDAMVVEAALRAGAQTLYSEDMNAGQQYGGLTIVNPFA